MREEKKPHSEHLTALKGELPEPWVLISWVLLAFVLYLRTGWVDSPSPPDSSNACVGCVLRFIRKSALA